MSLHEARHAGITIWAQALAGHASIVIADEAVAEVARFLEKHGG